MELRALLLIAGCAGLAPVQASSPVLRYPLDDRTVYSLKVGTEAPTTVMFPGPLTALDGAGLSSKAEDMPAVLLAHQAGARYFSVRALRHEARASANILFGDKVYAFVFIGDTDPDRTLTLYERKDEKPATPPVRRRPEHLLALLDQAKNCDALGAQYPALVQGVERVVVNTACVQDLLTAVIEEVFGFAEEDALVFRVRVENRAVVACRFSPAHLGIRIAQTVFPAALTDAPGALPPRSAVVFHLVVLGDSDGSGGHLSVRNTFTLAFPSGDSNG